MDLNHLSDEQIQNYLDNLEPDHRAELENHLHSCPHCAQNLQIYQRIYQQLRHDTMPNLSKNFSRLVLGKIKTDRAGKTYFWENISFIILLLIGAVGSSYLINPLPLFKSMVKPLLDVFTGTLGKVPLQLNSSLIIVVGGVVILIFYEYLNNKILKPKS